MGLNLRYSNGQTPINEEEKEGLKISSISTQSDLDQFEQLNIEQAVAWTIASQFEADLILTEDFIQKVHKKMLGDVWQWAGQFRKSNKNRGVPWFCVPGELKKLLEDGQFWVQHEVFPPKEIAIRFKHRLVSIHCFPNGNGRHARLMADIIMEHVFGLEAFNWHRSAPYSPQEIRKKYIYALQCADEGMIDPLIEFAQQ